MKQSKPAVRKRPVTETPEPSTIPDGPLRRAWMHALRTAIESVYTEEVKLARLRRRLALLRCGFAEPTPEELAAGDALLARRRAEEECQVCYDPEREEPNGKH